MKNLLLLFALVIGLSSCEFYYVEPHIDARDGVVGTYSVEERSETYNDVSHYTISVRKSGYHSNEIAIDNFYGVDIRVYATLAYGDITIYKQVVDGYEIEGFGTVYDGEIDLHYHVKDLYTNSRTDYCNGSAWMY